jgi:rhamnose transport system permease protein
VIDTSLVRWAIVSEFWREAVLGALILLSVTTDTLFTRRLFAWRAARAHARREAALSRGAGP